jgi:hypothetical protein
MKQESRIKERPDTVLKIFVHAFDDILSQFIS